MTILDRYIARQILLVTAIGVMALSALLLLGNLFKELRPLLLDSGAPASVVVEFIFQVIPFSLMFSIPWGFLTAVLLVYGRLAADNELTSMRMAGLSLIRLSMPALVIGCLLSGFCYWVNIEIAPKAKQAITELIVKAASIDPKSLLREGQPITKFDDQEIYIDRRRGDTIFGMHIYQNDPVTGETKAMHAEKVDVSFDEPAGILHFDLHNTFIDITQPDGKQRSMIVERMPWRLQVRKIHARKIRANRFTNDEIGQALATPGYLNDEQKIEFATELPRRASFSIACIVFALMGVPLAINARRRDTSAGFVLGILIAALYFVALVFADLSRKTAGPTPYILLWMPNVASIVVAWFLHKKALTRG